MKYQFKTSEMYFMHKCITFLILLHIWASFDKPLCFKMNSKVLNKKELWKLLQSQESASQESVPRTLSWYKIAPHDIVAEQEISIHPMKKEKCYAVHSVISGKSSPRMLLSFSDKTVGEWGVFRRSPLGHQAFTCHSQANAKINYSCDPGKGCVEGHHKAS